MSAVFRLFLCAFLTLFSLSSPAITAEPVDCATVDSTLLEDVYDRNFQSVSEQGFMTIVKGTTQEVNPMGDDVLRGYIWVREYFRNTLYGIAECADDKADRERAQFLARQEDGRISIVNRILNGDRDAVAEAVKVLKSTGFGKLF